ncbi:MAG TPA: tetratricopeptide repeat protein [Thermomicrobiales bacterium]|nr:tetratricopeptide repeat protein [Thermomicrobiales bacterium]
MGTSRMMKIGFITLAMLFTCSLLAGSLVLIPFDELFGLNDADDVQNIVDRNDELIEELEATVEANPDDVENVLLLANVLGNSGRLDDAVSYYEQAIELAPNDSSVRLDFARALADGGYRADAELQFERVLEMRPDSQEAQYYLAELYMSWDPPREEQARELYERAVESDPISFLAEQARNQLASFSGTSASPVATPAADGMGG